MDYMDYIKEISTVYVVLTSLNLNVVGNCNREGRLLPKTIRVTEVENVKGL